MTISPTIKRIVSGGGVFVLLLTGLLVCSFFLDHIPLSAARPPQDLETLDQFQQWKRGKIQGRGTFENAGVTYTVMLAPAGRYLESGPAAYLFDEKGRFVDWTADMGDFHTVKNHFDLTSGHVGNIKDEPQ